ncbi:MAG: hypothetical protein GY913_07645 [Proteobacteria bacterium]|nr:hypothetical protein [Pseudomonadota bacterium]MCP4916784.1 hypothetical protein [Pseudomonadota bacterium]
MLLLITTVAHAGHREGDLEFDRLDRSRGVITYELDAHSVRMLRHLDVTPTMAIWQDNELLWSQPITRSSGSVQPPNGMNGESVQVTLVGFHRGWWIRSINGHESLTLEGYKDTQRSRYAQSNASHRHDHGRNDRDDRDEHPATCSDPSHEHSRRESATTTSDVTKAIEACDFALWDDDLTMECARAAARSPYDAVALVEACDDAFWDDEDVVECVSSY